jgi:excisionase family DNA binding protein
MEAPTSPFFTRREAIEYSRLSRETIRLAIRDKLLRVCRPAGSRRVLIRPQDLEEYLGTRKATA